MLFHFQMVILTISIKIEVLEGFNVLGKTLSNI